MIFWTVISLYETDCIFWKFIIVNKLWTANLNISSEFSIHSLSVYGRTLYRTSVNFDFHYFILRTRWTIVGHKKFSSFEKCLNSSWNMASDIHSKKDAPMCERSYNSHLGFSINSPFHCLQCHFTFQSIFLIYVFERRSNCRSHVLRFALVPYILYFSEIPHDPNTIKQFLAWQRFA